MLLIADEQKSNLIGRFLYDVILYADNSIVAEFFWATLLADIGPLAVIAFGGWLALSCHRAAMQHLACSCGSCLAWWVGPPRSKRINHNWSVCVVGARLITQFMAGCCGEGARRRGEVKRCWNSPSSKFHNSTSTISHLSSTGVGGNSV